jgi:ubiquinone/menaquinone biosynthesis C-methylase UbiE
LLLFHQLGYQVSESDLSESMLAVARDKIQQAQLAIPIIKADFQALPEFYDTRFDAVVCLSNAINEEPVNEYRALGRMKAVLNPGGSLSLIRVKPISHY